MIIALQCVIISNACNISGNIHGNISLSEVFLQFTLQVHSSLQ